MLSNLNLEVYEILIILFYFNFFLIKIRCGCEKISQIYFHF